MMKGESRLSFTLEFPALIPAEAIRGRAEAIPVLKPGEAREKVSR